jgi:alpha-tubulin suppressor-like RCC1 family protein
VEVPSSLNFIRLTVGGGHACGIIQSGALYCWGLNSFGQVGDGTQTSRVTPVRVGSPLLFRDFDATETRTCAIATDDRTYCWGANMSGESGQPVPLGPARVAGGLLFPPSP